MLEFFWKYFKGYVIIEVKGKTLERFLNMAAYKNIKLWDIHAQENMTHVTVKISDFKKLRYISRKTNCKYRIIKKYGAPFFFYRYRKRKILLFGLPFFLLFLYTLTSFIWSVDIIGYERIDYTELSETLHELGIREGAFKHFIAKEKIEDHILDRFPEISFINLDIRGTRAILTLSENIPDTPVIDRSAPINLVADRDALIQSIYVRSGVPLVDSGDVVAAGDMLVSGTITNEVDQTTYFIHASADIRAYVYYTLDFFVSQDATHFVPSGKSKRTLSFNLFGKRLTLPTFKPNFDYAQTDTSRTALSFGAYYPLPFILITETTKELIPTPYERTEDDLLDHINLIITESILHYFDFDVDISKIEVYLNWVDRGVEVHAIITTLENITTEDHIEAPIHTTAPEAVVTE